MHKIVQIREGFSPCSIFLGCQIKHPDLEDEWYLESLYDSFFAKAQKLGIKEEQCLLAEAKKNGHWTADEENAISSMAEQLKRSRAAYDKVIDEQREYLAQEIQSLDEKLHALQGKRAELTSRSAEYFGNKMSVERFACSLIYKNGAPLYSKEDVEYLSDDDILKCINEFFLLKKRFSTAELKKLALTPSAQNMASLAKGPMSFMGKPAIKLNNFQTGFIFYCKYYREIIGQLSGKIDDYILKDPESLDMWVKSGEDSREKLESQWKKGGSPLGGEYEQIKRLAGADKKTTLAALKKV